METQSRSLSAACPHADRSLSVMIPEMNNESSTVLLEFARMLAHQAVELARKWSGEIDPSFKRDGSVVTAVDRALQEHIVGEIARRFPGHAICAEEKMQH